MFTASALLFDMDGVLVDSAAAAERIWRRWAERHGLDPEPLLAGHHGRPSASTIAEFAPHVDVMAESEWVDDAQAHDIDGVVAIPGAVELVGSLPRDRWAVVTSAFVPLAESRLRAGGLPVPEVLITPERLRAGKPDPEGFLAAAAALGREPAKCLVVEDAPPGIAAARAAGMRVVALTTTHDPAELRDADAIVPTLREVAADLRLC
jgi:sugar-phosphatase